MKTSEITNSINTLPKIGPAKAALFAKLNVFTVADLLQYYPRDYEDRTKRLTLYECLHTVKATGQGSAHNRSSSQARLVRLRQHEDAENHCHGRNCNCRYRRVQQTVASEFDENRLDFCSHRSLQHKIRNSPVLASRYGKNRGIRKVRRIR